jgi:hypothetical protein
MGNSRKSHTWDGSPETPAETRFFNLRESGYKGWIDRNGDKSPCPCCKNWSCTADLTEPCNEVRVIAADFDQPRIGHSLKVELRDGQVVLTPVCHEPDGAFCRDGHECYGALFLGDFVNELCALDGPVSLYDGMPIKILWDGDCVTWEPKLS